MTISMFQPNSLHSLPITQGKDSNQPRPPKLTLLRTNGQTTPVAPAEQRERRRGIISSRLSIVLQRQAPTQGGEEAF